MSDIVERLREADNNRKALYLNMEDVEHLQDAITALRAEVERLTRTSEAAKENRDSLLKAMIAKDAEVERLRAALKWFVDEYENVLVIRRDRVHAPDCRCILCACANARAELEER